MTEETYRIRRARRLSRRRLLQGAAGSGALAGLSLLACSTSAKKTPVAPSAAARRPYSIAEVAASATTLIVGFVPSWCSC